MKIGVCLCSGVGEVPGSRTDGTGEIAAAVERLRLPGVEVLVKRITSERFKPGSLREAAYRTAKGLLKYDRIILFGHSRGGLYAVHIAQWLKQHGRDVDAVILADAWHGQHTIVIPANVHYCEAWVQQNGLINGSDIKLADAKLTLFVKHDVEVSHHRVDNLAEVKAAVLKAVSLGAA